MSDLAKQLQAQWAKEDAAREIEREQRMQEAAKADAIRRAYLDAAAEKRQITSEKTKEAGAELASETILADEKEASFVVVDTDESTRRVTIKKIIPRTSREEATSLKAACDPEGLIFDAAQAAFVDAVRAAWSLHKDNAAFAKFSFETLYKAMKSLHSRTGTIAGKSAAKLRPIAKALRTHHHRGVMT